MTASPTIRPATAADQQALGRLGALLVGEHYRFDPRRFLAPVPGVAERYGAFLVSQAQAAGKLVLVAEVGGAVAGYVFGGMEGHDFMVLRGAAGELYDLVVDPAHRRQGIGRKLLEAAVELLAGQGAPRVVLFTADKNGSAQAMFASAGFRRTMIEMTRDVVADPEAADRAAWPPQP
jgi:ribosomal protein S18 acetylase RimI-like enzyme